MSVRQCFGQFDKLRVVEVGPGFLGDSVGNVIVPCFSAKLWVLVKETLKLKGMALGLC